nr:uncharacterized protein LOC111513046 [Leptinotarsa decemlineata]
MPLAKLPKAFGLDGVKKGYFPHLFNKAENWNYVGPLPALGYYDPESIKYTTNLEEDKDPKKQLIEWHKQLSEQGYVFDFQKELVEYCQSDVDILSRACLKFRELMIQEGGVDPFTEAITLPELCIFTEKHPLLAQLPLNPRDAFYGGRTDATKLYYKCKEGEKIKYVDVCSLYPFINKYGKYPVGHPEVFVGEECNTLNLNDVDGIIKCKVLPPQNLYHPVLPVKMNGKLMFPLCRSCCEHMAVECTHICEEERALSGTWVIDEVLKALEKGYKLMEIYEIWKYKVVQYDPAIKSGGLFSEYISKFLKIKQQASGWPSDCISEQQKNKYIQDYYDKEGVTLCAKEIEFNPGRRQIGKSVITSFWGKLGRRENQQKTSIVSEAAELFDMLSKPFIVVNSIFPVNENTLIVNWTFKDEAYKPLSTVNVVLAAYTTAQARLESYKYMEKLDIRVLCHNTDSVTFISRPGMYDVLLGSFLGEMNDELSEYGNGSYITDFVSGGPKLYAYRVYSPMRNKTFDIIKVKGIILNYNTYKQANLEKLTDMVINENASDEISAIDANNWIDESNDEDANIQLEEVIVEEGVGVDGGEIDLEVNEVENEANENEANESDEDDDMVDELIVDGEGDDEGIIAVYSEGDDALRIGLRMLNIA